MKFVQNIFLVLLGCIFCFNRVIGMPDATQAPATASDNKEALVLSEHKGGIIQKSGGAVNKIHDEAGKVLVECEKIVADLKKMRTDLFNKYVEASNKIDDFSRTSGVEVGKLKDEASLADSKSDLEKLNAKLEELNKAKQSAQAITNDAEKQISQVSVDFAAANKLSFEMLKATEVEAKANLDKINEALKKIKTTQESFVPFNKSFDDISKNVQLNIDEVNSLLKLLNDKVSGAKKPEVPNVDLSKNTQAPVAADVVKKNVEAAKQNSVINVIFNKTSAIVYAFANLIGRAFTAVKNSVTGYFKQAPVAATVAPVVPAPAPSTAVNASVGETKWKTYAKMAFSYLLDGIEWAVKFIIKATVATYYFLKDQVINPFISDVQKRIAEQKQAEASSPTEPAKPEVTKPVAAAA